MPVKKGDKVKMEYEGKLENGEVFDSSEKQGKPLEFTVGEGKVIKGIDEGIVGMKKGDEKEIEVPPAKGYGDRNPQLVQDAPRKDFPDDGKLKKGVMIIVKLPDGRQFPAKVVDMTKEKVKLDFNHPLAGKTLNFKVKIVDIVN